MCGSVNLVDVNFRISFSLTRACYLMHAISRDIHRLSLLHSDSLTGWPEAFIGEGVAGAVIMESDPNIR
jgi:hypothetical protein